MVARTITLRQIRNFILLICLILVSGGAGYWLGSHRDQVDLTSFPPRLEVVNRRLPAERRSIDFGLFWNVWEELERSYLDPASLDPEQMVYGAISGMTAALGDPYTVFLKPDENKQNKENLEGSFYGVGIQIGYKNRQLAVIAPLKGMPADKAGVMAGDWILQIKDERKGVDRDTQNLTLPEAVTLIRGEQGTVVTLILFREGADEPFEVELSREEIQIPSVELVFLPTEKEARAQLLADSLVQSVAPGRKVVAHLKVSQFGAKTNQEWNEAVAQILAREAEVIGLVLDFRNNPGGFLNGAIDIASEFLADGTIVVQQGRYRSDTFRVERRGRLTEVKIVVLINEGSASASEIVAGALRDRRGVILVGEQTFGKGTVQEAKDLPGGAGLHVTTSKWILPSGQEINEKGLTPNEKVSDEKQAEGEEEVDEPLEKAIEIMSNE